MAEEPDADQGVSESESFIQQARRSEIETVPKIECKRRVKNAGKSQKPGIGSAEVQDGQAES